jgi:hypothetical protein
LLFANPSTTPEETNEKRDIICSCINDGAARRKSPGTILEDTPAESTGADSGVIGAPSIAPKATQPVGFKPLTASERLRLYLKRTYGPLSIVQSAAGAGISQWRGAPKEWKQGAEAYGDRFGNSYAKHVIRGTLEYGASAMLHEDNRYVPSLDTGFLKRTRHAIASTFVARNDAGHEHFAYSRFGSALGAAFISRIWQPPSRNGAGDGLYSFGITMANGMGWDILREFWPDVRRGFKKTIFPLFTSRATD